MAARKTRGVPFQKGFDPRRHIFTREECKRGFAAATEHCTSWAQRRHCAVYRMVRLFYHLRSNATVYVNGRVVHQGRRLA